MVLGSRPAAGANGTRILERLFRLTAHGTDVKTELVAGLTTFLTMAYITVVNPSLLSAAGMDYGAVFVATCLAAALGSLVMGLFANYPVALAPGLGLSAFFSFTMVGQMGHPWQVALGAVFMSGASFFLLSVFRVREWIINSVPQSLRMGIAAGIGLFLALIGLQNTGIIVADEATLVTLGTVTTPPALLDVATLMAGSLSQVDWGDVTEAAPVVVTTLAMPLTFSIASGIALGFITYVAVKLLAGRARQLNAAVLVIATLFVLKFAFLG